MLKVHFLLTVALCLNLNACGSISSPTGCDASSDLSCVATVTNSLGLQMVLIPSGEFTMGNHASSQDMVRLYPVYGSDRLGELEDESPLHRVRITRAFYLARHELTVGQFRRFLQASGHVPESIADGTGAYGYNPQYDPAATRRGDAFEGRSTRYSWENPGFPQTEDHPVVNVTWNDAQALARWLSQTENRHYRLPTEAEWEYACRASTATLYHSGDQPISLSKVANIFDADAAANWPIWREFALPIHDGFPFTAPVGSFAPNSFGLHDMHGNVWEWTADWHAEKYYAESPRDDPQGPQAGIVKIRRGGSWHTWPLYARCAYRNWNTPETRYVLVGIRLVMDVPK